VEEVVKMVLFWLSFLEGTCSGSHGQSRSRRSRRPEVTLVRIGFLFGLAGETVRVCTVALVVVL